MSLDHDLQNLPRLTDDDREALNDDYSVMPAVMNDEAIARRNAAQDARQRGPMWPEGPAYEVIAMAMQQALCVVSTVALALEGMDVDDSEELRITLLRCVSDPLYELTYRLKSANPAVAEVD